MADEDVRACECSHPQCQHCLGTATGKGRFCSKCSGSSCSRTKRKRAKEDGAAAASKRTATSGCGCEACKGCQQSPLPNATMCEMCERHQCVSATVKTEDAVLALLTLGAPQAPAGTTQDRPFLTDMEPVAEPEVPVTPVNNDTVGVGRRARAYRHKALFVEAELARALKPIAEKGGKVTPKMVGDMALEVSQSMDRAWKPSPAWVTRFCKRHGLR